MFDINAIVNDEIRKAYQMGQQEMLNKIMNLLAKHNATPNNNYIAFVEELMDLKEEEQDFISVRVRRISHSTQ